MKKHKKTLTVVIILIVALLMFASFFGVYKKNENGEKVSLLPNLKLGMEFGKTRVITASVNNNVNKVVYDAEGNVVKQEEGVEYTEENGCGSIDFMFRGLRFHIWEYEDRVWGAETNVFEAGRSQDIEGDYEEIISGEILSWPDMLPGM